MTLQKAYLKLDSEIIRHSTSSFYTARTIRPRKRVVVKAIEKSLNSSEQIKTQCCLFRWFAFFGMIDINKIYDLNDLKIIEMPDTKTPIDIISDDCTISEKSAIGLLHMFLDKLSHGNNIFTDNGSNIPEETRLLASTICALLSGTYTNEIIPGEPLLYRSHNRRISRELDTLLQAMLCSDPAGRPTPEQCLDADVFRTMKGRLAVEDISSRLHPIVLTKVAPKKADIDNVPCVSL